MLEKPQSNHVLGLDIDAFSLKGASVIQSRGKLKLDKFFDFFVGVPDEEKDNVKPLYTADQKKELQTLSENNLTVTSAITQDILVRPLELKLIKDKDIEATFAFQVEPLLPYPIENAVIDKILLSKDKEGSRLTVFAIRKDHLTQHIAQWNGLEINPEVVSAAPQALVLFTSRFLDNENPYLILHIGIEHSFGVLVDQGKLLAAQSIPAGLNSLIEIFGKEKKLDTTAACLELYRTPFANLQKENSPEIKSALDELRMTTTRTVYSLTKQFKGKEVNHLIVTGPGAMIDGFSENLCAQLNKTLLIPKEDDGFGASRKELLNYALPIGGALSALPGNKDQINFRQQEFLYPEPWKRHKKPILLYFLLCLGIAVSLFLFGKSYASYRQGEARQQYLHLLKMMNKPYTAFEKEYHSKTNPNSPLNDVPAVQSLSLNEINQRLNYLEKDLQSTPQTFPLQPNVPLVSDVLAWISSHPNFINAQKDGTSDPAASMQIVNFSYSMVKRPEPAKKQEKYEVKVELEFSSPTPKTAREFHDALIAPNDMVDPKGEIKWNSNRDVYRTSFYLKDKTVYPNL
jgi:type IV pilus assembly protein PilM